jgi:hypothetical protein
MTGDAGDSAAVATCAAAGRVRAGAAINADLIAEETRRAVDTHRAGRMAR